MRFVSLWHYFVWLKLARGCWVWLALLGPPSRWPEVELLALTNYVATERYRTGSVPPYRVYLQVLQLQPRTGLYLDQRLSTQFWNATNWRFMIYVAYSQIFEEWIEWSPKVQGENRKMIRSLVALQDKPRAAAWVAMSATWNLAAALLWCCPYWMRCSICAATMVLSLWLP